MRRYNRLQGHGCNNGDGDRGLGHRLAVLFTNDPRRPPLALLPADSNSNACHVHAMYNEVSSLSWAPITLRLNIMTVRGDLLMREAGGQQRPQLNPGEVYSEAGLVGHWGVWGMCLGEVAPQCR